MKYWSLIYVICYLGLTSSDLQSQTYWQDIQKLDSLDQAADKPIFLFVHADWCQYCIAMEQKTFQDKKLTDRLQQKFHLIKLNPEEESNFVFRGQQYLNIPTGYKQKTHQFIEFLSKAGSINYPSIFILSPHKGPIQIASGFVSKADLSTWLDQLHP